jgi:hypothetical protein
VCPNLTSVANLKSAIALPIKLPRLNSRTYIKLPFQQDYAYCYEYHSQQSRCISIGRNLSPVTGPTNQKKQTDNQRKPAEYFQNHTIYIIF